MSSKEMVEKIYDNLILQESDSINLPNNISFIEFKKFDKDLAYSVISICKKFKEKISKDYLIIKLIITNKLTVQTYIYKDEYNSIEHIS